MTPSDSCKSCETRRKRGFPGQCPACAKERTLAQKKAALASRAEVPVEVADALTRARAAAIGCDRRGDEGIAQTINRICDVTKALSARLADAEAKLAAAEAEKQKAVLAEREACAALAKAWGYAGFAREIRARTEAVRR